jgi:hypothetical protein
MGTFSLQLDAFIRKTGEDADKVVRQASLSVLDSVVKRSPVDTGRFRGNWQLTINTPAAGSLTVTDKSGAATIGRGLSALASYKAGPPVWITNNLPYARRLEDGYSDQAPQGMVRLTVQQWNRYINDAIARVSQ